jgi:hypothetical protein
MSSASSGPSAYELFTPLEQQFEAESTLVTIEPNFQMPEKLEFISSTFGPFIPGLHSVVPLWLAVILKENQQCRIISPPWLQIEALEQTLEDEVRDLAFSSSLPYHYVEIAEILLRHARDDLSSAAAAGPTQGLGSSSEGGIGSDRVQWLIDRIQSKREEKLALGTRDFFTKARASNPINHFNLANIGALETNIVREGLTKAMDIIFEFYRAQSLRQSRKHVPSGSMDFSFRAAKSSSDLGVEEEEVEDDGVNDEYDDGEAISEMGGLAAVIRAKAKARAALSRSSAAAIGANDGEYENEGLEGDVTAQVGNRSEEALGGGGVDGESADAEASIESERKKARPDNAEDES